MHSPRLVSAAVTLMAVVLTVAAIVVSGSGSGSAEAEVTDVATAAAPTRAYAPKGGFGAGHAYRPKHVALSGDSTLEATRLHWRRWGKRRAVAIGTIKANTCAPSCAEGSWRIYRHERLVLSRPRHACESRYFTRARITGRFGWHTTYDPLWCPSG